MYEKYKHLLKTDSTERQNETYQTCKARYGGIVLSLDGIQPAKGNEPLYVLREVLCGKVIASISMKNGSSKELKEALEPYVNTDVPILGFVRDRQRSIRKALKELRSDVPFQFCQFHYLKDISKPMIASDRKLKTTIKKNLRGLQAIEVSFKQNEQLEEKEKEIINGYCEAIRSILLEDGKPSLELPGMKIYERLEELKKSFEHSLRMVEQKKRLSVYLKTFPTMINRRNHKRSYHKVQEMYEIIRDIVKSLEKTSFSTSQSHEEALKSLLIKAFQEKGQKHGMKGFMENLK